MAKKAAKPVEEIVSDPEAAPINKGGRPRDSANKQYDVVEASPTSCAKCGSTDRASYDAKVDRQSFQNTHVNPRTGREFNVIEYRSTKCLKCGQHRRDKTEVLEDRDT